MKKIGFVYIVLLIGLSIHNISFADIADNFDYPLGSHGSYGLCPDSISNISCYWICQDFLEDVNTKCVYLGPGIHLGEDWNRGSGVDDVGDMIYAVADGKIVYTGSANGWAGNIIIIQHVLPDGTLVESLYGHIGEMLRTSGNVKRGDEIGKIGNTDRPHLHFEIRNSNCREWGRPGPGYSSYYTGWTDPSDFIQSHQYSTIEYNFQNNSLENWRLGNNTWLAPLWGYPDELRIKILGENPGGIVSPEIVSGVTAEQVVIHFSAKVNVDCSMAIQGKVWIQDETDSWNNSVDLELINDEYGYNNGEFKEGDYNLYRANFANVYRPSLQVKKFSIELTDGNCGSYEYWSFDWVKMFIKYDPNACSSQYRAAASSDSLVDPCDSINDSDNDGVCDISDNCQNTYNPDQQDTDGDGKGDVCDNDELEVMTVIPTNNSDISVNTQIAAQFSNPMNSASVNTGTFLVSKNGIYVNGLVELVGSANNTVIFTPNNNLDYGTTYEVRILREIKDTNGNNLASDCIWSFTTQNSPTIYYTVRFIAGYGGTIEGNPSQTVLEGSNCSEVKAVPNSGYSFVGWSGEYNGTENPLTVNNVALDMDITANFTSNSFSDYIISATWEPTEGGIINPAGNVSVAPGENKIFSISPNNGYQIANVVVDDFSVGAVSSYTFTNIIKDHTINASFERLDANTHIIRATDGKEGGNIKPWGDIEINHGADITFTITPDPGYYIADVVVGIKATGLGKSVGPVESYTFQNVTEDQFIIVVFNKNRYNIKATAGLGGSIEPVGDVSVWYGANQDFSVKPDLGFEIESILVDGKDIGKLDSYTFVNVTQDHTIEANFIKNADGYIYLGATVCKGIADDPPNGKVPVDPTDKFSQGDTVYFLMDFRDMVKDYRIRYDICKGGECETNESPWHEVGDGWQYAYYYSQKENIEAGEYELRLFIDTDRETEDDFIQLDTKAFSVEATLDNTWWVVAGDIDYEAGIITFNAIPEVQNSWNVSFGKDKVRLDKDKNIQISFTLEGDDVWARARVYENKEPYWIHYGQTDKRLLSPGDHQILVECNGENPEVTIIVDLGYSENIGKSVKFSKIRLDEVIRTKKTNNVMPPGLFLLLIE